MTKKNISTKKDTHEVSFSDIKSPLELIELVDKEPEIKTLWGGIEEVSFGYVFGPSKAGKTIFCENLAISLATGKENFFGKTINSDPKKIYLAAMEEDYRNRTRRLKKQISNLSAEQISLLNQNLVYAGKNFPRFLNYEKDWQNFEDSILDVNPDVVIIDSFTRIIDSDITNRDECRKVLKRLRNFAYDNNICTILIHHSTKNQGKPLTMDSMAGSSVLSQEADFSIGINVNGVTKSRYVKEVFYRYDESSDKVISFEINSDTNWLQPIEETSESSLVSIESMSLSSYDLLLGYLKSYSKESESETFEIKSSTLKTHFVESNTMASRTFDYNLKKVVNNNILVPKGVKGNYVCHISQLTQQP